MSCQTAPAAQPASALGTLGRPSLFVEWFGTFSCALVPLVILRTAKAAATPTADDLTRFGTFAVLAEPGDAVMAESTPLFTVNCCLCPLVGSTDGSQVCVDHVLPTLQWLAAWAFWRETAEHHLPWDAVGHPVYMAKPAETSQGNVVSNHQAVTPALAHNQ